jgi:hypothetical protein
MEEKFKEIDSSIAESEHDEQEANAVFGGVHRSTYQEQKPSR